MNVNRKLWVQPLTPAQDLFARLDRCATERHAHEHPTQLELDLHLQEA